MMNYVLSTVGQFLADSTAQVSTPGSPSFDTGLPKVAADNGSLQMALQILFGVLAAVAVLIIVIAALRMLLNAGEPETVKKLRRTLTYAAIGLILALTADAMVGFVLSRF